MEPRKPQTKVNASLLLRNNNNDSNDVFLLGGTDQQDSMTGRILRDDLKIYITSLGRVFQTGSAA